MFASTSSLVDHPSLLAVLVYLWSYEKYVTDIYCMNNIELVTWISGASLQRQGKYREAIKYHNMVLGISKRVGDLSGNTEAYGAIADCYTELGELEKAGKFYDKYIARLEDWDAT